MLLRLVYSLVRFIVDAVLVRKQSDAELRAELLALRHQLRVLQRQVSQPAWEPADRLLLAALARALPRPAWRSLLVRPETLLRWHRQLVRRPWSLYARRRRSPLHPNLVERHHLILRLARENPKWGYRRIRGELLKLGHRVSHITVRNVLRRHAFLPAPRRSRRSWQQFVRRHADQLLATDFFVMDTIWLTQIYVLAWTIQDDEIPSPRPGRQVPPHIRRPLRDRGCSSHSPAASGAPRERFRRALGGNRTSRGQLIFGRRHLDRVLREFVDHFHLARPHQGLKQQPPDWEPSDPVVCAGPIVRRDRLGGLIQRYERAAA